MRENIKEKVFTIFSDVMDIPKDKLKLESNPDNISNWDSMSHVKIIMQIEHQFNISLLPEEATEMLSIKEVIDIISAKIL